MDRPEPRRSVFAAQCERTRDPSSHAAGAASTLAIPFHTLRHYAATTLAGQGIGVRTIAGRLGHANPSVTLRTYAHFLDAADREAADLVR
jgi:integrase